MAFSDPFPPDFDVDFYRRAYGDLAHLANADAAYHFEAYGRQEGRAGNGASLRENLLPLIPARARTLEIGPFHKPCIRGPNVDYFDVLTKDELIERARSFGFPVDEIPVIQFVSRRGDLTVVSRTYDFVVSSHCIEHQPDLIRHLRDVAALLNAGGHYVVIAPDKRYCFDHFNNISTIAEIVQAHEEGRTIHTLKSIIEHRALTTHNDPIRHWQGDHGMVADKAGRTLQAIAEFRAEPGRYIDVHAWYFTPDSFREAIAVLIAADLIPAFRVRVYNTVWGRNEFCAILSLP